MELTETQLGWIVGCVLLVVFVAGWPVLSLAYSLIREERVLGKLYWHWQLLMEGRRRKRKS